MPEITAFRGSGLHPGPDIVEPLLSDTHALLQRARQELDGATPADEVRLTLAYTEGQDVRLGDLVEVLDGFSAQHWRGYVTGINITVQGEAGEAVMELTLWRPRG